MSNGKAVIILLRARLIGRNCIKLVNTLLNHNIVLVEMLKLN